MKLKFMRVLSKYHEKKIPHYHYDIIAMISFFTGVFSICRANNQITIFEENTANITRFFQNTLSICDNGKIKAQ